MSPPHHGRILLRLLAVALPCPLAVLATLLFFLSSSSSTSAEEVQPYDLRNAVVLVAAVFEPDRITVSGTGFIVHPLGLVLTNGHLASGRVLVENRLVEAANLSFRVWLGAGSSAERELPAFRVALTQKDGRDFALLQLPAENAPYPFLKLGRAADVSPGSVVRAIGFPLGTHFFAVAGSRPPPRSVSGLILKMRTDADGKPVLIDHSAPIIQGFSGGPLLSESGAVVGINTWAVKESPERLALPAELAANWISSQGFSVPPASPTELRPLADRLDWINLAPITEAPQKIWCLTTQNFNLPAIHKNSEVTLLASRNYLTRTPPRIVHLSDDGSLLWTKTLPDDPTSPPVLVPPAGFAFLVKNSLYLYNDAGEMMWERSLPLPQKLVASRVVRWLPPVALPRGLVVVGGDSPDVLAFNLAGDHAWRAPVGPAVALLPVAEGVAVLKNPADRIGSPDEIIFLDDTGAQNGRVAARDLSPVPGAQFVLPVLAEPGGDLYARVTRAVLSRLEPRGSVLWSRSDFEMWQGGELGSADAPTRLAVISARGEMLSILNKLNGGTVALIPPGASASWMSAGWIGNETLIALRAIAIDQGTVSVLTVFREKEGVWQPVAQWRAGPGPGLAIPAFRAFKTRRGDRIYAVVREGGETLACALVPPAD